MPSRRSRTPDRPDGGASYEARPGRNERFLFLVSLWTVLLASLVVVLVLAVR